jgi:archaemetzincin
MSEIYIIPFHFYDHHLLDQLALSISAALKLPTRIESSKFRYSFAYDSSRKQYHSTRLLHGLVNYFSDKGVKLLGVTDLDLFIPILTFVFGEAQLNGRAATVSSFRLKPQFYGLPKSDHLLLDRLSKESIHELGHTFGLKHCLAYDCVMSSSPTVEDIELKDPSFCDDCLQTIKI